VGKFVKQEAAYEMSRKLKAATHLVTKDYESANAAKIESNLDLRVRLSWRAIACTHTTHRLNEGLSGTAIGNKDH
jgi:hypothetical protein